MNYLDRDSQSKGHTTPIEVDFARFIIDNLLYLDYGVIQEVFTVIHSIDRILSSTGVSLRQCIENRDGSEPLAALALRSIVFSLMIGLKRHLKTAYNLSEAQCRTFDPKKTERIRDNKSAVRSHIVRIVDWSHIPYLEKEFEDSSQMEDQLDAV